MGSNYLHELGLVSLVDSMTRVSHRVVEHSVHYLLVWTGVIWVTIKDFAYAVDARGFVVAGPEIFLDMFDCVDAKSIDYILVSF